MPAAPSTLDSVDDPSLVSVLSPEEVALAAELARLYSSDDDRVIYVDEIGEHGLDLDPLDVTRWPQGGSVTGM
jgi:hypothetical protein